MILNVILNAIGILIFFINRFSGRKSKTKKFSLGFWLRDNFQELSTTLLLNVAFMIILNMKGGSVETLILKLPVWLQDIGIPGLCFVFGLGFSHVIYQMYLKKVKDI